MENISISVVIPAYNEEKYIRSTVEKITDYVSSKFSKFEIIVIDDGSTDNTSKAALSSPHPDTIKILRNQRNMGKGYSVKRGVLLSSYEYIVVTDSDLSVPIDELGAFIEALKQNADIAIGSRALKHSNIVKPQSFIRRNMGRTFNVFVQMFLFKGIKDTQCGFKCFKHDIAQKIFKLQRVEGFCFDAEIIHIAKKMGCHIQEIPVRWQNREDSRVLLGRSSIDMFFDIFKIRMNNKKGVYETK